MRAIVLLLLLAGCATPKTIMKNDKTGQIQACGGSVGSSIVGHYLQKSADAQCVIDFQQQGFKIIKSDAE